MLLEATLCLYLHKDCPALQCNKLKLNLFCTYELNFAVAVIYILAQGFLISKQFHIKCFFGSVFLEGLMDVDGLMRFALTVE